MARVRPDVRYEVLDWGQTAGEDPERIGRLLDQVAAELADGRLRPLPCRVFDLAQVGDAFRLMAQGRHLGKIVVRHPAGAAADPTVRADGTYLITGGMGGIGLRAATWLVERGARHVVLTGRRAPGPEAAEAIAGMERAGARVMAAAADAADGDRMTALLEDVRRRFPPLRGVIHSAGVLDDGILTQQDWGRFRRVLAPKLDGGVAPSPVDARRPAGLLRPLLLRGGGPGVARPGEPRGGQRLPGRAGGPSPRRRAAGAERELGAVGRGGRRGAA